MRTTIRMSILIASMAYAYSVFAAFNHLPNYYPNDFIQKLESGQLSNTALKRALKELTEQVHVKQNGRDVLAKNCPSQQSCEWQVTGRSYREAREVLFGEIHLVKEGNNYKLDEVYCEQTFDEEAGVGPGKIPDHNQVNCEHTWPQSRFNPRENINAQLTDLHHLYPANSRANSSRGNLIFAEVDGRTVNNDCVSSRRGRAEGSSETAFEPPPQHRGDVARALFYFSVRYNNPIGPLEEKFLRKWHEEDPVDDYERNRHEKIYAAQKNRNPFIDAPELVDLLQDF